MKKLTTSILYLLLIIIAVGAYIFFNQEDTSLVVAPASYNFGNIDGQSVMHYDFQINNWKDSSVTLSNASGSQNDIKSTFLDKDGKEVEKITVQSKGNAILRVQFDPTLLRLIPGNVKRTASFKTSTVRFWKVNIPIEATIIPASK